MLQTSLLLMKSLNKTETPIFLSVVCSLFPKAIFLTFFCYEYTYLLLTSFGKSFFFRGTYTEVILQTISTSFKTFCNYVYMKSFILAIVF